jgi:hypothetical protein
MARTKKTSISRRLFITLVAGVAEFLLAGPALSEALVDYGFAIFSPTFNQNASMFIAWIVTFPAQTFFESFPFPRIWYGLNGVFWGFVCFFIWVGLMKVKRHVAL